ncbi:MAG: hypothetical protein M0D55_07665 [Elusimicrobiota bacterium]|nr:MAG: hypothetical protein M0D55_07665 [Elusimicrobiota bacterium]
MNYAVTMRVATIAVLAASLMTGCGGVQSRVTKGVVQTTINQDPDKGGYIEAIGIGASDPDLESDTQRKSLARDAAIVKAQYELLAMVKGVELEGGYTIERAIEEDSNLESRVHASIQGAEILKSEFTADNGCVVTMRLPKSRLKEMMGVAFK